MIDMTQPSPTWRQVGVDGLPADAAPAHGASRRNVLATGGSRNTDVDDRASAVLPAELWNPDHRDVADALERRRPAALPLVRDAATRRPGRSRRRRASPGFGVDEYRSEIFSPPYLFKGARPTITSAPPQANYGQSFFVATPDGATITKVALIPQPTVTHA